MSDRGRLARTRAGDTPSSTSTSLLERLKVQDQEAWRKLVGLYEPLVYQWCRRRGIPAAEAQDLVQEVFRAVASGLARFRHDRAGDTFRGWLKKITENETCNHFARRAKGPPAVGGSELQARLSQIPEQPPEDPSDAEVVSEQAAVMHRALNSIRGDFQQQTWQAFWRVAIDGQAAVDVARDLGMTSRAVRQAKHRVLQRLRDEFHGLID